MTIARNIILTSLLALAAVYGGITAADLAYADGVASVDAGPAPPAADVADRDVKPANVVPDPVAAPVETAGEVVKLWKSGHILAALIIAVWGMLLLLSAKVAWLREGKRAVYIGIAATFLGAFVERAAAGSTPTLEMLLAAGVTAAAAVLSPSKATPAP